MSRPSLRKRWPHRLAGAVVSLATFWLASRGVAWRDAGQGLAHVNWLILGIAAASHLVTLCIRVERWRYLFYPQHKRLHLNTLMAVYLVGQLINTLIPARIGELARAYLVGAREGVSKAQGLWTTVMEKVLDSAVLLIALGILSSLVSLPPWLEQAGWFLSAMIALGALSIGLALVYRAEVHRWLTNLESRRPWLTKLRLPRMVEVISANARLLRRPELSLGLAVRSLLAFGALVIAQWLTARALSIALPWRASIMLVCVLQLSAIAPLPTAPGRVGLFHYLAALTLSVFGIERGLALSYALVLHLLVYLPIVIGGPLSLWRLGVDWRDVTQVSPLPDDGSKAPSCQ